jgi:bifunctional DNA-binding transcriptional regulator/antitoxin component of YhaV-PrlF toxin-antitoxin module
MSSKGQVVIPIAVRRKLRLVRDAEFLVEVEGDRVVLTPLENASWRDLPKVFAGRGAGEVYADLEEDRRRERARDDRLMRPGK